MWLGIVLILLGFVVGLLFSANHFAPKKVAVGLGTSQASDHTADAERFCNDLQSGSNVISVREFLTCVAELNAMMVEDDDRWQKENCGGFWDWVDPRCTLDN